MIFSSFGICTAEQKRQQVNFASVLYFPYSSTLANHYCILSCQLVNINHCKFLTQFSDILNNRFAKPCTLYHIDLRYAKHKCTSTGKLHTHACHIAYFSNSFFSLSFFCNLDNQSAALVGDWRAQSVSTCSSELGLPDAPDETVLSSSSITSVIPSNWQPVYVFTCRFTLV